MKQDLFRIRQAALNSFLILLVVILLLSAVSRILVGDYLVGSAIVVGVAGVCVCVWHLSGDLRWFRRACLYPTSNIFVSSWGYHTDGEPICRLYLKDAPLEAKTFSLCFNVLLPPKGGQKACEDVMCGLEAWMASQPCTMRLLGHISANCQFAEVELCVRKKDASMPVLEAMYDSFERVEKDCYERYHRRYIKVDYPEQGHVFYAAFDGFDIGRAVIRTATDTAYADLGDSRQNLVLTSDSDYDSAASDALAKRMQYAFDLYVGDCEIETIRQTDIISVEEFEQVWQQRPAHAPTREERYGEQVTL